MSIDLEELRRLLVAAGVRPEVAEKIDPAVPLLKQGLDSVDFPSFCAVVEERAGVPLDEETALTLRTLNDFVAYLAGRA